MIRFTLLSALILAAPSGAGAALDAQSDALEETRRSRRPTCVDCSGGKLFPCAKCGTTGKVMEACRTCRGRGTLSCSRTGCTAGMVGCEACKGAGGKKVIPIRGKPRFVKCSHCRGKAVVKCFLCKGSSRMKCGRCDGKSSASSTCTDCAGSGKVKCAGCSGEGVGRLPELGPADRGQLERLLAGSETLLKSVASAPESITRAAKDDGEKVEALMAVAGRIPEDLRDDASTSLRAAHRSARASVKRLKSAISRREKYRAEAVALAARVEEHTQAVESARGELEARLEGPLEDEYVDPVTEIDQFRRRFEPARKFVDELGYAAKKLKRAEDIASKERETLERDLAAFREESREASEQARRESVENAREAKRARAIEGAVPALAERAGYASPRVELDTRRSSLRLELGVVADENDDEPGLSDSSFQPIPALVSEIFEVDEGIARITFHVETSTLDETGHRTRRPVQSFVFEEERWKRLLTGAFKDDWKALLSKSRPSPPYPGEPVRESSGNWPFMIAIICGVLIAISMIVRFITR